MKAYFSVLAFSFLAACAAKTPAPEASRFPASLQPASLTQDLNICMVEKEYIKPFHEAAYRASFGEKKPVLIYGYATTEKGSDFGRVWTGKKWVQLTHSFFCSNCDANYQRMFSVGDAEVGKNLAILQVDFVGDYYDRHMQSVELRFGEPRYQAKEPKSNFSDLPFDQTSLVRMKCELVPKDLEIKFK